jgi:hypothetical protein
MVLPPVKTPPPVSFILSQRAGEGGGFPALTCGGGFDTFHPSVQ